MRTLIFFFFLPLVARADYSYDLPEEEINPPTEDILIGKPEKYLRNESMIYDLNTDLGIKDQRKYTGTDRNRISFAGHLSAHYEHLTQLLGGDFSYLHRSDRYDQIWYGFQVFSHRTRYDAVAETQLDEAPERPGDSKGTVQGIGLGVSYRFKLLLDFWPMEDRFENIDVFANYVRFSESFESETYQGWGLTTSYGFIKRSSTNFYYGPKLTYNLAPLRRSAQEGETSKKARELTIGWLSAAFEIGFFY